MQTQFLTKLGACSEIISLRALAKNPEGTGQHLKIKGDPYIMDPLLFWRFIFNAV